MMLPKKMLPKKDTSAFALTLLLALAAAPKPLAASVRFDLLLANAPAFSAPNSVPNGTSVRVTGVPGMGAINQTLKQQFEKQFSGTAVNLQEANAADALRSVLQGNADLAAIRRPLTAEEKSQGLVEVPVSREKIAIVIGANNPFKGELTNEEFAAIFRGEITDWQTLGGAGAIRMIDRPETSDLRQAFRGYPVFQNFSSGANVARLQQDSTEALIQALGADGIGYAPVSQVANNPNVRILAMYGTLPTDPSYPFSQPFSYVYKGPNPSTAVQAFLGYALSPNVQPAVQQAKVTALAAGDAAAAPGAPAPAAPSPAAEASPPASPAASPASPAAPDAPATGVASPASPNAGANAGGATGNTVLVPGADAAAPGTQQGPLSWVWWLLPLGLIGLLFAWLLKGGREEEEYAEEIELSTGGPDVDASELTPTEPPRDRADLSLPDFGEGTRTAAIAGTGFATGAAAAVTAAMSNQSGSTANTLTGTGESAVGDAFVRLTPRNARHAYASWEVSSEQKEALKAQGGKLYALRLYDVTGADAIDPDAPLNLNYEQFECDEVAQDWHVSIPQGDRDYLVELGYVTEDGRWLKLARSTPAHVPPDFAGSAPATISTFDEPASFDRSAGFDESTAPVGTVPFPEAIPSPAVSADAAAIETPETTPSIDPVATAGAAAASAFAAASVANTTPRETTSTRQSATSDSTGSSASTNKSRITLASRNPQQAHVSWDVPEEYRVAIRQKGGEKMAIRLYDVTDIDVKTQPPHSVRQFTCNESVQEQNLPVPMSDRDYIAEIGYVMNNGRWLRLARSGAVHIPAGS